MKKKKENKEEKSKAKEPAAGYGSRSFQIFHSFQEQEAYQLSEMAKLKPEEILMQLRKFINIAYGMHGYDPDKLPAKHSIRIIKYSE